MGGVLAQPGRGVILPLEGIRSKTGREVQRLEESCLHHEVLTKGCHCENGQSTTSLRLSLDIRGNPG